MTHPAFSRFFLVRVGIVAGAFGAVWARTAWAGEDIRDIRPPVDIPLFWEWGLVLLTAALAGGGLVWGIRRWRRSHACQILEPARSPAERAQERMRALREADLPAQGRVKEFYTELSLILREYIEERFAVNAPEMTTEEFLVSLPGRAVCRCDQEQVLADFLTGCDLVKFARYAAAPAEMDGSYRLVEAFIQQTAGESGND